MGRGVEKGKDSTGSHPTHSDCHRPQWIIQSWIIFVTSSQREVPAAFSQTLITAVVMQRALSVLYSYCYHQCIFYMCLSILASTQDDLRSACGVIKYSVSLKAETGFFNFEQRSKVLFVTVLLMILSFLYSSRNLEHHRSWTLLPTQPWEDFNIIVIVI